MRAAPGTGGSGLGGGALVPGPRAPRGRGPAAGARGGGGLGGGALTARWRAPGGRARGGAPSRRAGRAVTGGGAEPLHTDLATMGEWRREAGGGGAVFPLGLPRLDPPLRPSG